jgi:hypothetical protein
MWNIKEIRNNMSKTNRPIMRATRLHPNVHGWLVLDKPLGLTSTQALGRARRFLAGKKAGHGGTLDPLATGNLTRQDGIDFLSLTPKIGIKVKTTTYPLQKANEALADLRAGHFEGAAVLVP